MASPASILQGIIPPLVTPLKSRDALDRDGLDRLLEHVLGAGVQGVFILGTTGEAPSLSYRLRRELIDAVCSQVRGRVPVLVGITDTSFVESIALAEHAQAAGAAAVVLSTPYYFPAGQTELTRYVRSIAGQLNLPLVLYNMPSLTKVWFEVETLEQLVDIDRIIGMKDSSGDLEYFERLLKLRELRPDWQMMIGPEALLPQAMELGGAGGVAGGANVFPEWFVACYQACVSRHETHANGYAKLINEFQRVYEVGKYASRHIKATKCCLSILGICSDFMADPFNHFLPPERARVAAILNELKHSHSKMQSELAE